MKEELEPIIKVLSEKKLIGKTIRTSLMNNRTAELWGSFMRNRKAIHNTVGTDLYSIQIYDSIKYFDDFNPSIEFTKCAMTEVTGFDNTPEGMEAKTIKGGLYAVFLYKGKPELFFETAKYIFSEWLPNSPYELDDRPHFELLGDNYKGNHAEDSEEEVWIPIR